MEYCAGCFQENQGDGRCPHCGYQAENEHKKYPQALPAGSILAGQFILGRVLGQGGFGITYLAKDNRSNKLVAIKEYFPSGLMTRDSKTTRITAISLDSNEKIAFGMEKFLEEAKTLAQYKGIPNIVDVYSYFQENGTAYFVMEYIEGISLKAYTAEHGGKLSWEEALAILAPVMVALARVHSTGFIHRDIAPDNIYIRKNGQIELLDFGSARFSIGDKSHTLDVVIKAGFAPKEQYMRRGRQGPYTDVYSLAATLYAVVTGVLPPEAIDRIDEDELVTPSTRGIHMPEGLEDAILKGLEVAYQDRFQSMTDFYKAIEPYLEKKAHAIIGEEVLLAAVPENKQVVFEAGQEIQHKNESIPLPAGNEYISQVADQTVVEESVDTGAKQKENAFAWKTLFNKYKAVAAIVLVSVICVIVALVAFGGKEGIDDDTSGVNIHGTVVNQDSLLLTGSIQDVYIGDQISFAYFIKDTINAQVESNDETIIKVEESVLRALSSGEVEIKVTKGKRSETCKIRVLNPEISLNISELNAFVGDTAELVANALPESSVLTWSSSDPAICTVDENGMLSLIGEGSSAITASFEHNGQTYSSQCQVTITMPSVQITAEKTSLYVGDAIELVGTAAPDGSVLSWSSSDPAVCIVDTNGLITAVGAGSADISASIEYNGQIYSNLCQVFVTAPSVQLSDEYVVLNIGDGYPLSVNVVPEGTAVSWTSSNSGVVSVNEEGRLYASAAGYAQITAIINYQGIEYSASCSVTVKEPAPVVQENAEIMTDATLYFDGYVEADANSMIERTMWIYFTPTGGTVSIRVADKSIASVDFANGFEDYIDMNGKTYKVWDIGIVGKAPGTTTCTITYTVNGMSASETFTIKVTE